MNGIPLCFKVIDDLLLHMAMKPDRFTSTARSCEEAFIIIDKLRQAIAQLSNVTTASDKYEDYGEFLRAKDFGVMLYTTWLSRQNITRTEEEETLMISAMLLEYLHSQGRDSLDEKKGTEKGDIVLFRTSQGRS